jgi:hypothetical protein
MIDFTCMNDSCSSKEIKNTFLGNPKEAVCGGCGSVLVGSNEQADPKIEPELEA